MKNAVEAILFLTPKPLKASEIAKVLGTEEKEVLEAIEELKERYKDTALTVEEFVGTYRLGVKEEYKELARKLGLVPEFSKKELRIIAMILKEGEVKLSLLRKKYKRIDELVDKLKRYGFITTRKEGRTVYVRKTKLLESHFRVIEGSG